MYLVIYSTEQENLIERAMVAIQLSTEHTIDAVVPHLFTQQTERLYGLYDSSLLGVAYKAFNWTMDEEYNEQRRATLTTYFQQSWLAGLFLREPNSVHVVLNERDLIRWLVLVQSIASRSGGETNRLGGSQYTAVSQFDIDASPRVVAEQRLQEVFWAWLRKAEE